MINYFSDNLKKRHMCLQVVTVKHCVATDKKVGQLPEVQLFQLPTDFSPSQNGPIRSAGSAKSLALNIVVAGSIHPAAAL